MIPESRRRSMHPSLSIIIPSFNSESTILQTLESCLNNAKLETEVMIGDDCSIDSTVPIIESFIKKNSLSSNIRLYKLKGHGPGWIRNRLARKAKHEFLLFLDSDDIIDRHQVDKVCRQMQLMNIDIGLPLVRTFTTSLCDTEVFDSVREGVSSSCAGEVVNTLMLPELLGIETSMCMKVFRSQFFKSQNIRFENTYFCEDVLPSVNSIRYADRVMLFPWVSYYYRVGRMGQKTSTPSNDSALFLKTLRKCISTCSTLSPMAGSYLLLRLTLLADWSYNRIQDLDIKKYYAREVRYAFSKVPAEWKHPPLAADAAKSSTSKLKSLISDICFKELLLEKMQNKNWIESNTDSANNHVSAIWHRGELLGLLKYKILNNTLILIPMVRCMVQKMDTSLSYQKKYIFTLRQRVRNIFSMKL